MTAVPRRDPAHTGVLSGPLTYVTVPPAVAPFGLVRAGRRAFAEWALTDTVEERQ